MAELERFFRELQRRRVFRVAFVYGAVAFIVWQAAEIAVPALDLPGWSLTLVVLLTLLGFPIALSLGWAFDITSAGVLRTESAESVAPRLRRVPGWLRRAELVVLVLAALFLLVWWPFEKPDQLSAFSEVNFLDSMAVLPIENRTGEASMGYLCAGTAEEIVGQLKRAGSIKIIDPYSVERLLALSLTTRQLADSLGVAKLIRGSLYRSEHGVRLNMLVSDGRSGDLLTMGRYQVDPSRGFEAAATEFADEFVGELLRGSSIRLASSRDIPNPQGPGYESYLVGKTGVARRTPEGLARAREAFEDALRRDPQYALAFSGLARVYVLADVYHYGLGGDGYEAVGLALAYANRAVELEPHLADAYSARALVGRKSFAPAAAVVADCERAVELEPAAADGLSWCAPALSRRGDADAGFRAAEQATALDPQAAGRRTALAWVALSLERYSRAASEARMAWQLEPEMMLPRAVAAWALLLGGEPDRCVELELGPHAVVRATCLHSLGRRSEAQAIVDSVVTVLKTETLSDTVFNEVVRAQDLAAYYGWTGDPRQSLEWLRRAYELSPSGVEPRVLGSALFDRVRDDPAFARAVEEIHSEIWPRVLAAGEAAYRQRVAPSP